MTRRRTRGGPHARAMVRARTLARARAATARYQATVDASRRAMLMAWYGAVLEHFADDGP